MLRWFESILDATGPHPDPPPRAGLVRFYWHFIRQARGPAAGLFIGGGIIALLDLMLPTFIGRIVTLISTHAPEAFLRETWPQLAFMAAVMLLARPAAFTVHAVLVNQIINPTLTNLIRWQNHWHVVQIGRAHV